MTRYSPDSPLWVTIEVQIVHLITCVWWLGTPRTHHYESICTTFFLIVCMQMYVYYTVYNNETLSVCMHANYTHSVNDETLSVCMHKCTYTVNYETLSVCMHKCTYTLNYETLSVCMHKCTYTVNYETLSVCMHKCTYTANFETISACTMYAQMYIYCKLWNIKCMYAQMYIYCKLWNMKCMYAQMYIYCKFWKNKWMYACKFTYTVDDQWRVKKVKSPLARSPHGSGESSTTVCGVNYQQLAVMLTEVAQWAASSSIRPQPATDNGVRDSIDPIDWPLFPTLYRAVP